jgi:putative RecB family exonuclease
MAFALPTSLSPSKVASFKDCAMAFRFSAIDRVPEPPTIWAAKGTLVHRALELLFAEEPADRTIDAALRCLGIATPEVLGNAEYSELTFASLDEENEFMADCELLVHKYFQLEDPTKVRPVGLEMKLEVDVGSLRMRGIIDRLDEDEDGNLIVVDYKTGKVPRVNFEASKLGGVHFYAFLCEKVLGRRPKQVQLLYLAEPLRIITEPTDQSIRGLQIRTNAIWNAVEKACEREDFRPKPSRLCDWCSYKQWCPAFGGDPAAAPKRSIDLNNPFNTVDPVDAAIASTVQDLEVQLDTSS